MQIALTKKLAKAMEADLPAVYEEEDPIFCWTANWTKVWDNRRTEDMLVLVNKEARFAAAVYEVKRKDLKKAPQIMYSAIEHTLLHMNFNPELVKEYLRLAGEVRFVPNRNRQTTAWVNQAGTEISFAVDRFYNGIDKVFTDTLGAWFNYRTFGNPDKSTEAMPIYQRMSGALAALTGLPVYDQHAFELLVTLDLEIYKATRRIIVPQDMSFHHLHRLLQAVFNWKDYHLYDFAVPGQNKQGPGVRLVASPEDLEWDESAVLMEGHTIGEFMPNHKKIFYTYDMGDSWEHEIKLLRVIEHCEQELPCLLEADGQAPPEDVGGVGGFIEFREAYLDENHPEHEEVKEWIGYWSPDLNSWQKSPKVIHIVDRP